MKRIILILLTFWISFNGISQNLLIRNDTVPVLHNGVSLEHAWASGINAAEVSEIDLNLDGLMDLFFFEPNNEYNPTTGDKIYPFINLGGPGMNYKFAPEYREKFPPVEDHALLRDYNCDGKMDLFTRDIRDRFSVYTNVSDTALKFELFKRVLTTDTSELIPNLNYFHWGEIYWSYSELPSITDVDGDGDLDILSPSISGHFLEYNKNMSVERYGHCDSLEYVLKNTCWGEFYEDLGLVFLDSCDVTNVANPESRKPVRKPSSQSFGQKSNLHSSTTVLAIDLDGDQVMDLIEGDADRPHLYMFKNDGKKDSSHIGSYVDQYPPIDSFNVLNYGSPSHVDVDNDGLKDLIISVFYDRYTDTNSIWFYKNVGNNSVPSWSLTSRGIFQDNMIDVGSGAYPVFFDYNGDSLMDLVIGNEGYFSGFDVARGKYRSQLAVYENIGTDTAPAFKLISLDYDSISQLPLNTGLNKPSDSYHPTFADLDNDGDEDMMMGDWRGRIHYFENQPQNGKAHFVLITAEFQNIKVGNYSAPQLFDLDQDGKADLLIGDKSGKISYYRNTSNGSLQFDLLDSELGNVDVRDTWDPNPGYSRPFFYLDSVGQTKLFVGTKGGHIRYYDSLIVGDTLAENFRLVERRYQEIWEGNFTSVNGTDIDGDGQIDLIIGNQSGGVSLFTSLDSIYIPGFEEFNSTDSRLRLYPNPANELLNVEIQCDCQDRIQYRIFNMLGNLVLELEGSVYEKIDLNGLDNGMYILQAVSKNRLAEETKRFVIQR